MLPLTDPLRLIPDDLPSSEELRRAVIHKLREAIELRALQKVAQARERAAAKAAKAPRQKGAKHVP